MRIYFLTTCHARALDVLRRLMSRARRESHRTPPLAICIALNDLPESWHVLGDPQAR